MSHFSFKSRFILSTLFIFTGTVNIFYCAESFADDKKDSFLNIKTVTSPSGITAWLVEDHSIPIITMEYAFRDSGSKTDPVDKQGLARMASNTMDEGAGNIKSHDFQKELQDLSISLSFDVSRDNFGGHLKTLTKNKDRAFTLLKTALTSPRFDLEAIERMREANKSRIKSSISDPKWIAARIQNDRIFENHPYAMNSGGTLTSLNKITADDLKTFHATLGKNNIVIGVAGDITPEELAKELDEIFGSMPETTIKVNDKTVLSNAGKAYLFKMNIPQTIIEIAQKGVNRTDKDYHTAQIMNYILGGSGFGSRLMEEVREKRGLSYGIYTYFNEYEAAQSFHVTTSTVNESAKEVLNLINQEWDKIKTTPVSMEELKSAKSYLIGSLPLSLTSSESIAQIVLSLQLDHLPTDYLDTRRERLNAITPKDIQETSQRLLDSKSFTTILVGNPQKIETAEVLTTIPNVE